MVRNSIKIALRGIFSNPLFSSFNLASIVLGLAIIFIAIGYISYENSYDDFHEDSDDIYRLGRTTRSQDYSVIGFPQWNAATAEDQLKPIQGLKNINGVKSVSQFVLSPSTEYVEYNGNSITATDILSTNTPSEFFEMFSWKVSEADVKQFSSVANSVMLSQSVYSRLFGNQAYDSNDIKQVLVAGEPYFLAGVFEDIPNNSHFNFTVAIHKNRLDYWGSRVYIQTTPNYDHVSLETNLNNSIASINPTLLESTLYKKHFLQPIGSIHLDSNILYEMKTPGNKNYIWLIGFFAILITCITLFNYSNFTLAIKSKNAKQIGVKKALGASRFDISRQFLFEGILLALSAVPIVVILLSLVVPHFNSLMDAEISTNFIDNPSPLLLLISLAVFMGILASVTPAIVLSTKETIDLFQERLSDVGFRKISIRKYLVISQFVVLLTISAVCYFVVKQMDYVQTKDLGFDKSGVLYVYTSEENQDIFQNQLKQLPEVKAVGNGSSFAIGTYNNVTYQLDTDETIFDDANQLYLDYNAITAYNIETTLSPEVFSSTERNRITLINETAAKQFATILNIEPIELIGRTVITEPDYVNDDGTSGIPFTVDGIFKDINLFSLKEQIAPYFITVSDAVRMSGRSIVSFDPENADQLVSKIKAIHAKLDEPFPLEFEFLDTNFEALHRQDKRTAELIVVMNVVALSLAVIGIIGITLLLLVGRKKEIGIRKVLGATVSSILTISIKEYIAYIAIALVISWPLAYLLTRNWLANFAYRIDINQLVFIIIALVVFVFTAVLVALTSYKTAVANPVKSLRTE